MMTLESNLQSEGDIARLYKGRYEDITKATNGSNPNSDNLIIALKDRLSKEADYGDYQESKKVEMANQLAVLNMELVSEKKSVKMKEETTDKVRKGLIEEERAKLRLDKELEEKEKKIEFLESEMDRLRDERNEQRAYSQQLYEELWENEGYGEHEEAETGNAEATESSKAETVHSRPKISRREADKIFVPHSALAQIA